MRAISVLGAGSWGTALAVLLSRKGHRVTLWSRRPAHAEELQQTRLNQAYLPDIALPPSVRVVSDPAAACVDAELIVCAVPSQHVRATLPLFTFPRGAAWVSATKGIEADSLMRMSQLLQEKIGDGPVVVLSGPSFALEAARGDPTAVVASSDSVDAASLVQQTFSSGAFRVYTNNDTVGTEVGGAIKNVIAIAAGVVFGLGFGSNTVAGLITRGLSEICRLAVAMGGRRETLAGLAGLGDLVLTCTGPLSRNRGAGIQLAKGRTLSQIAAATSMAIEGIPTTRAALRLAEKFRVEMPITEQMHQVLYSEKSAQTAVSELMERRLREEL